MDNIKVKKILAAVFDKKVLDSLVPFLRVNQVTVFGTEGTVSYLKSKGCKAQSIVKGFDYDGRVKTLARENFAAILADRSKPKHIAELKKAKLEPVDVLIVDLYKPDKKNFPETMDIGGQALIRAGVKNFTNVAVCVDKKSVDDLAWEIKVGKGETSLKFRKKQAKYAVAFIAKRTKLESDYFKNV